MNKIIKLSITLIVFLFFQITIAQSNGEGNLLVGNTIDYSKIEMNESPSAAKFNIVTSPEVNIATGTPIINIPLYTYEIDGVKIPISISYDASGVRVSQMATSVGLNWSLNAGGQISRTIRARPDENYNWGWFYKGPLTPSWFDEYDNNPSQWQKTMVGDPSLDVPGLAKLTDHNPDLFTFSFLEYSGTYIHNTDEEIIQEKKTPLEITSLSNFDDNIEVKDFNGNYYLFGCEGNCNENKDNKEKSNNRSTILIDGDLLPIGAIYDWEEDGFNPTTAWKLSKIVTKNSKTINLDYHPVFMNYDLSSNGQITVGKSCRDRILNKSTISSYGISSTKYNYSTQLLDSIYSPDSNIVVRFKYETETNLPDTVWPTKLNTIEIEDTDTGRIKKYHFYYERFSGDPRLKLTQIVEVGIDENYNEIVKPPYNFDYMGGLPPKSSIAQDLYGYFNNRHGGLTLVPSMQIGMESFQGYFNMHSTDRSMNPSTIKNGILEKIEYPTGGSVEFKFEPNALGSLYSGGLRVQEIFLRDQNNSIYDKRTYTYENLIGRNIDPSQAFNLFYKIEGESKTFYSEPVVSPGDLASGYKTGYFYKNVTVRTHNIPNNEIIKEEYIFEENIYNYQKYDYLQKAIKSYIGNTEQAIRIVEYENNLISTPEYFEWVVLDDMMCYWVGYLEGEALGYKNYYRIIQYSGNYAFLPTRIATTEFLKQGNNFEPVTMIKDIFYDPETLLKTKEITDLRYKRHVDGNNNITYQINDPNAEKFTVDYTYSFDGEYGYPLDFPKSLVLKQEILTEKSGQLIKTNGRAFEFDSIGNIKKTYQYKKGVSNNNNPLEYIPNDYEEMTSFIFHNGHLVQVREKNGSPTSYVWSKKYNFPVAKIEGLRRTLINQQLITEAENANYQELPNVLNNLRNDPAIKNNETMITTFTFKPLAGVEKITDPKGEVITYEYDAFGRLEMVRDQDGNIISENEYHFAND